jgi:hypothetical protein
MNVSTATVTIASQSIDSPGQPVDLSGIDQSVANRIADSTTTQGTLFLTITTPYSVSANATMTFTGTKNIDGGFLEADTQVPVNIAKAITLPAKTATESTFTIPIQLTGKELRLLLGTDLTATFTGTTNPGSTIVTPASEIQITGRMQIKVYAQEIQP